MIELHYDQIYLFKISYKIVDVPFIQRNDHAEPQKLVRLTNRSKWSTKSWNHFVWLRIMVFRFRALKKEREEVERVVGTFSGENRGVHGLNMIDFNKGRACGARRRLLKGRTVWNRFRISWIATGWMNRRRDRVFLSFFPLHVYSRIFSIFLSLYLFLFRRHLPSSRLYPKRTKHPLLNAALLSDKAWKGSICLASVCSIVDFFFRSTSFRSLLSTTLESFAIFSVKLCFRPRFSEFFYFLFRIKENTIRKLRFMHREISTRFVFSLKYFFNRTIFS